jgi:aspartyl-tRNA(Asn)/glutamyl-tRNA(Gln) amidotransferase subunit A
MPMTGDELCMAPLADVANRIQRREISPVEVTSAVLERIARLDSQLNAFITVTADLALAQAREAESAIQRGEYRGPLHGIPLSLKDLFATRGIRTTAGSVILAEQVPQHDATVTRKLSEAGAILVGKANMLEFAYGEVCPTYGPSRNPWNVDYATNGSSSGSAAAVAAGLGYASMGSDTGGSIRLPAAWCGIVGLKPTYGLVSRAGVTPLSWSLDHVGPMTRTVRDCALVLDAVAGFDTADSGSIAAPRESYARDIESTPRLRVGVVQPIAGQELPSEIQATHESAAERLRDIGLEVRPVALPYPDQAPRALMAILYPEASTYHRRWLEERADEYTPNTRERLQLGAMLPAQVYLEALRARRVIADAYRDLLQEVDLLLTPIAPVWSYRLDHVMPEPVSASHGADRMTSLVRYSGPFDLTGLPAISVPVGVGGDGLPIGAQLVGGAFGEVTLLQVAHALEQAAAPHLSTAKSRQGTLVAA